MQYVGVRTVKRSIEICERRRTLCVYVAGGLGGLGLFGAGDAASAGVFGKAPAFFLPLFLSTAILSGALIAWAYSGYEYHGVCLQRKVEDSQLQPSDVLQPRDSTPTEARISYLLGTIFLGVVAAVILVVASWCAAVTS
jgi:hypothetical protein